MIRTLANGDIMMTSKIIQNIHDQTDVFLCSDDVFDGLDDSLVTHIDVGGLWTLAGRFSC